MRNRIQKQGKTSIKRVLASALAMALFVTICMPVLRPVHVSAANFSLRTGSYLGSGTARSISGLGFQPDFVIINPSTTAGSSVFKTSSMPANTVAFLSATANNTTSAVTLDTDGFSLSTLANVNSANVMYRWTAIAGSDCSNTGYMCIGTYTGNGAATRTITTGFQPNMVMNKRSTNVAGHFRTSSMAANRTEFFPNTAADTAGNYIRSMAATSFTVGATDNTNGGVYYYLAFRENTTTFTEGTYTGNGVDNRSITGLGYQPDTVFVKNSTSATANNRRLVMSSDKHYGDSTSYTADAVADTTNMIQGMQADGFTVGTGANVNENASTLYWFAFGGDPGPTNANGSFSMAQGSYTGNGANRSITGIGFEPNLVMVSGEGASFAVYRTDQMIGDATAYFASATADFTGGVTALTATGFNLGTSTIVNATGTTYHWQAFGNAYSPETLSGASDFATGVYAGNGIDTRNITGLPFQPDLIVIKRNGASLATIRTSQYSGDLSGYFSTTADAANMIQALNSDGFQVGTSAVTNTNAGLYRWFAFKTGTNFALGSYTGNGVTGTQVAEPYWSDLIWVNRSTGSGAVLKPSTLTDVNTMSFLNSAMIANGVTSINAEGFVLGNNAAVNTNGGSYRTATWRVPPTGTVGVDIVDQTGTPLGAASFSMSSRSLSFTCTQSTGTLGVNTQRIRVSNMSANPSWGMSLAPTAGPTALWANAGSTKQYDFNDPTGVPSNCSDGTDTDNRGGQLTVNTSSASLAPSAGCFTTSLNLGTTQSYIEGTTDSIALLSAGSTSNTECAWDLTNLQLTQHIPAEQSPDNYTLNMTLTVTSF